MHKLLERQLRRHFGSAEMVPAELGPLLAMIDASYTQNDGDRALLDHSMNTVSQELLERNQRLGLLLEETAGQRAALEQTKTLLRSAIEATADGILVLDAAQRIVLVNRQFIELWRLPAEQLHQRDRTAILAGIMNQVADPTAFHARIDAIHAVPEDRSFDLIECRDGRMVERDSRPQRVNGETVGRVWSFRDVTAHFRAERAALESQERFERIARATNDAIYDWDLSTDVIWWNDGLFKLFGYAEGTGPMTLSWWRERVHPEDRDEVERTLAASAENGSTGWQSEYRFRRADGRWATVYDRCYFERDAAGRPVRGVGAMMDVTERRRQQEGLARLAAIMETTTDYVGTVDASGRLLYLNQAARNLMGLERDSGLEGYTVEDAHRGWAESAEFQQGLVEAMANGSWSGEAVIRAWDGREVPVSTVILAHRRTDGTVDYISTIARDVSGVQKLRQQLLQSQKMDAIGQLAGGVAHDFNNLLTVIQAHCDFLREGLTPGHALRADVDAVAEAGDRAAALTGQLLAFSRQQLLKPVPLDLDAVVSGMEPMLRRLIGEDIECRARYAAAGDVVRADPRQLEQVLLNLAINARDAMPGGGLLSIETGSVRVTPGLQAARHDIDPGDYATLTVSDTGSGMSEDVRARIFDPFFTTKELGKGTGLGLSTVYGIVKQSGGHIVVESRLGQGSSFTVLLPHSEGRIVPLAPPVSGDLPRGSEHVLLVEDEDALRRAAERVLSRCGYSVTSAADGSEALWLAAAMCPAPAILVTDVVMPRMSGRELADRLRLKNPDLAVLFMSGYTEDDVIRRGVTTDEAILLQKPFTPSALAQQVRQLLDQHHSRTGDRVRPGQERWSLSA